MQNFGGVSECVAQIATCYDRHNSAEGEYSRSLRQMDTQKANIDALHHVLSFCVPSTLQESCLYAAVLSGWIQNSTIEGEREGRERVERMLRNLIVGLKHLAGDDFSLPEWTEAKSGRECHRVSGSVTPCHQIYSDK